MRYLVIGLLGLLLAVPAAGQITLDDYLGPTGTDYWRLGCQLRGAETACAAIDAEIEQLWVNSCPERVAPIPLHRLNIIRYRLDFERRNQGRTLAHAVGVWGPCTVPTEPPPGPRTGIVRSIGGGAIADDGGEFLALGATFFPVVYWERTDPARLDTDLAFLRSASRGAIDYVRILGAFGGDCSTYWGPIRVDPEAADYRAMLAQAIDHVYDGHGMRVQITIFGGDCSNKPRRETIDDVLAVVADGREHKIIAYELVNEGWQVEYSDRDQIRADTRYLLARTQLLVAPTAWSGQTCDEWLELYAGLGATLFTVHHDRATNTVEGGWRPPRQPWELTHCTGLPSIASSNEPIGPGSSVANEEDPFKLVAGAVVSYISGHAMSVFHSSAGVRGDVRFSELPNVRVTLGGFAAMNDYLPPDLVRWTHQNHYWAGHPFESARIWPADGPPGVVRSYAAVQGNDFRVLPMGINGGADLEAKRDMTVRFIDPLTGVQVHTQDLVAGETFRVNDDWPAIWVEGEWR